MELPQLLLESAAGTIAPEFLTEVYESHLYDFCLLVPHQFAGDYGMTVAPGEAVLEADPQGGYLFTVPLHMTKGERTWRADLRGTVTFDSQQRINSISLNGGKMTLVELVLRGEEELRSSDAPKDSGSIDDMFLDTQPLPLTLPTSSGTELAYAVVWGFWEGTYGGFKTASWGRKILIQ